ncbi:hypothetical protein MKW92_036127, partial [Papaver armeniacum]
RQLKPIFLGTVDLNTYLSKLNVLVILKKVPARSIMIWIMLAKILAIIHFLRCLVAGPLEINSEVAILWAWELLTQ